MQATDTGAISRRLQLQDSALIKNLREKLRNVEVAPRRDPGGARPGAGEITDGLLRRLAERRAESEGGLCTYSPPARGSNSGNTCAGAEDERKGAAEAHVPSPRTIEAEPEARDVTLEDLLRRGIARQWRFSSESLALSSGKSVEIHVKAANEGETPENAAVQAFDYSLKAWVGLDLTKFEADAAPNRDGQASAAGTNIRLRATVEEAGRIVTPDGEMLIRASASVDIEITAVVAGASGGREEIGAAEKPSVITTPGLPDLNIFDVPPLTVPVIKLPRAPSVLESLRNMVLERSGVKEEGDGATDVVAQPPDYVTAMFDRLSQLRKELDQASGEAFGSESFRMLVQAVRMKVDMSATVSGGAGLGDLIK